MATKLKSLLLRAFLVRGKARAFPAISSTQLQAALFTQEEAEGVGQSLCSIIGLDG